ncbi:hypothetical protein PR202_gb20282 [Eleusine coracana subsp. coracana]|uniref:Uncharacterized protein n=1 Tax=Eleusine coracana subsp. coracana TaxID=191504 RepID=A0AAV5FAE6_ELECO|nr:hypothetical protein PR202_gb20282 [Eleusine coracana subsp. coracana]
MEMKIQIGTVDDLLKLFVFFLISIDTTDDMTRTAEYQSDKSQKLKRHGGRHVSRWDQDGAHNNQQNTTLEVDKNLDGKNDSCATKIDKVSYEKLNEFAKVQFESRSQITQEDVTDCAMHVDDEVSLSDATIMEL